MGRNRAWTPEEIEILRESWGNTSIPGIAKRLNRTEDAIKVKVVRLKLGKFLDNNRNGRIAFSTFAKALGHQNSNGYMKISWAQNRGLPLHRQIRHKQVFEMVDIDEFWEWAERNQSFIDFSGFERHVLGVEPEWVEKKRQRDISKIGNWKVKNVEWTKDEDERLLTYLKEYKYNWEELSVKMHRTCGAIQRRICVLGCKERPLRKNAHEKWTEKQLEMLNSMILSGSNYQEMQTEIGKSEKAIRGKVYVLHKTEVLDKARQNLKKGAAQH